MNDIKLRIIMLPLILTIFGCEKIEKSEPAKSWAEVNEKTIGSTTKYLSSISEEYKKELHKYESGSEDFTFEEKIDAEVKLCEVDPILLSKIKNKKNISDFCNEFVVCSYSELIESLAEFISDDGDVISEEAIFELYKESIAVCSKKVKINDF